MPRLQPAICQLTKPWRCIGVFQRSTQLVWRNFSTDVFRSSAAKKKMKTIYKLVLIASIAVAVFIYGLFFNRLSETEMIRWSYVWFPGLLFGVVGLKAGQTSLRLPIIVAVVGIVALFVFFEMIFPAL